MAYPKLIENLIEKLIKLPGVGRRSAERMAFWFLDHPQDEALSLAESIVELKEKLRFCRCCNHLTDTEVCSICLNASRDHTTICVVEDPKDVIAIEKAGAYKGIYFVLLGTISPAEGRGPDDIKTQQLFQKIAQGDIKEVIVATDPDNEGEMTALYLIKQLKAYSIKVSRIGIGLPMGSAIEYADISTLTMSLSSRREVGGVAE